MNSIFTSAVVFVALLSGCATTGDPLDNVFRAMLGHNPEQQAATPVASAPAPTPATRVRLERVVAPGLKAKLPKTEFQSGKIVITRENVMGAMFAVADQCDERGGGVDEEKGVDNRAYHFRVGTVYQGKTTWFRCLTNPNEVRPVPPPGVYRSGWRPIGPAVLGGNGR